MITPSATKCHATSPAVRKIRVLQEGCAICLDVIENLQGNAKVLVSQHTPQFLNIYLSTTQGIAQMVALMQMMLTGLSSDKERVGQGSESIESTS